MPKVPLSPAPKRTTKIAQLARGEPAFFKTVKKIIGFSQKKKKKKKSHSNGLFYYFHCLMDNRINSDSVYSKDKSAYICRFDVLPYCHH